MKVTNAQYTPPTEFASWRQSRRIWTNLTTTESSLELHRVGCVNRTHPSAVDPEIDRVNRGR